MPDENVGEENTPQQNTITGTSGDDVLQADDDGDRIEGGGGDDSITGGAAGTRSTAGWATIPSRAAKARIG